MRSVLQYAAELPPIVRMELEQLIASMAGPPIPHTPVLTADAGTVTAHTVAASYSRSGRLCTVLMELEFTPSTTPSVVYATLPLSADATRNTTVNSSIYRVGTGPDTAFCKVVVYASGATVCLYRSDFSGAALTWAAIRYSVWLQVSYYVA